MPNSPHCPSQPLLCYPTQVTWTWRAHTRSLSCSCRCHTPRLTPRVPSRHLSFICMHLITTSITSSPPPALSLQAYFFRAKLPITDYINDTKTVLDQAPRVLNALLDVAVEMGLLDVALALTVLSKMIVQVTHPLSPPPPLLRAIVNCS